MAATTVDELKSLLSSNRDDDGLVSGVFDEIEQDWVRVDQFWVRLDKRFPWQLAQCLRNHSKQLMPGLSLRLNSDEVEPVQGHYGSLRKAYWWGAKFRWDDLDSYGGPLETVHGDPASPLSVFGYVAKAVFRWNRPKDQPIAILEIEEFRDSPQKSGASYTTRYLHSILDRNERKFFHLDGAVKTYTPDAYQRAYEGQDEKAPQYEKLFRTDQKMAIGEEPWLGCVASFFALDPLVREYFGGVS
jgi:hypothetical protein